MKNIFKSKSILLFIIIAIAAVIFGYFMSDNFGFSYGDNRGDMLGRVNSRIIATSTTETTTASTTVAAADSKCDPSSWTYYFCKTFEKVAEIIAPEPKSQSNGNASSRMMLPPKSPIPISKMSKYEPPTKPIPIKIK